MAKIAFSKLNCKLNDSIVNVEFDNNTIEIKQYLPINTKLELISYIINNALDGDKGYYNEGKLQLYFTLGIMFYYTNINFTEKQKSDPCKLYDLIMGYDLFDLIMNNIPTSETGFINNVMRQSIYSIHEYNNSVMGILDAISLDYANLNFDAGEIQKKLNDPKNMALLREVLSKLG